MIIWKIITQVVYHFFIDKSNNQFEIKKEYDNQIGHIFKYCFDIRKMNLGLARHDAKLQFLALAWSYFGISDTYSA